MKKRLSVFVCTALLTMLFSSCTNVADIGKPVARPTTTTAATTASTTQPATTTTTAQTTATTEVTTAGTSPSVNLPAEQRSPGVTYFVPASAAVSSSYFDDAVFVGDSVSLKLMYYDIANSCLGGAIYLTSGSLGVANAMWDLNRADAVHPSYQGETVTVVDGIAKAGCSKVYFMLGVNDLGLYGVEQTVENFKTLTDQILAASPDVTMYIQSVTPLYDSLGSLTNSAINDYNQQLSEYCREKGWYFVDVASVLRDENGYLPRDYCSDPDGMGIHFTNTACSIWVDYLYTHTAG